MFAEVVTTLVFAWLGWYVLKTYLVRRKMPPGPFPLPIIGNLHQTGIDIPYSLEKICEKYGDVYTVTFPIGDVVIVNSVASMKEALVDRKDDFAGRASSSLYPLDIILERGDIVSSDYGPALNFRRKVFKTALHLFGEGTQEAEERVRDAVQELLDEIEATNGKAFSPKYYISTAIVILLWKWLVAKKCSFGDPTIEALLKFNHKTTSLVAQGSLHQLFPFLRHFPLEFHRTMEELEKIKEQVFESEAISHRESYTDGVIRDITDSFMFAYEKAKLKDNGKYGGTATNIKCLMIDVILGGADTTSGFFNWFILYMVLEQDMQKQLQKELDRVVGRDRMPCLQDVPNLHWLQATVCEVMRHSSFLPVAIPHSTIRNTVLQGYEIPKGTVVFLNLFQINKDPNEWDEPLLFKPDRFLDASGKFVGWTTIPGFVPFGLGRRNCVGESLAKMQVFIVTSNLLHQLTFEAAKDEPKPTLEVGQPSSVRNPKDYKVIAKKRL